MGKNIVRATKTSIGVLESTLKTDPVLESALKSVKPEMAAAFNGVYPEFIRNCGERTKELLISFIITYQGYLYGSGTAQYKPISLLSLMYKLLERMIL
jgi:hypothetical protein